MPLCLGCGSRLAQLMSSACCPRCGRASGPYAADESGCGWCRGKAVPFAGIARIGQYESPLNDLIQSIKYQRESHLAKLIGRLLSRQVFVAPWFGRLDFIIPVPLFWRRTWWRGFNQAKLIARELSRHTGLPLDTRVLARIRHTPQQVGMSMRRRLENVRGAFAVPRAADRLRERRVLLIDDVMTSGATLSECTRTLMRAGADEVFVAVAAVAGQP